MSKPRIVAFFSLLVFMVAPRAESQSSGWRPTIPDSAWPRMPEILRSAGVTGTVAAEIRVEPTGRVVPRSLRVQRSDHSLFSDALQRAVARWRFAPWSADSSALPRTVLL